MSESMIDTTFASEKVTMAAVRWYTARMDMISADAKAQNLDKLNALSEAEDALCKEVRVFSSGLSDEVQRVRKAIDAALLPHQEGEGRE